MHFAKDQDEKAEYRFSFAATGKMGMELLIIEEYTETESAQRFVFLDHITEIITVFRENDSITSLEISLNNTESKILLTKNAAQAFFTFLREEKHPSAIFGDFLFNQVPAINLSLKTGSGKTLLRISRIQAGSATHTFIQPSQISMIDISSHSTEKELLICMKHGRRIVLKNDDAQKFINFLMERPSPRSF
ncbi:hypothetical protein KKC32_02295 [Patescibacteria group bacterium]|nr:hypothetical protein [Patescibacteria group bacterium]